MFRPIAGTIAIAALLAFGATSASAASDDSAVLGPLAFEVVDDPIPVRGADGQLHLAYEMRFRNQSGLEVTPELIQPVSRREPIGTPMTSANVGDLMRIDGGQASGITIPPGGSGILFVDVAYAKNAQTPRTLRHRVSLVANPPDDPSATQSFAFTGVPVPVDPAKVVTVKPPLRGPNWVIANGCCSPPNAHRGATLAINGVAHVPERYAIDFVQMQPDLTLFSGPVDQLTSYPYFGDEIRAAAAGKVLTVVDAYPEQVPGPGNLPPGQTVQSAGGNHVVVDIGGGRYAFYAHMQPGSVAVAVGDRVRAGQVLGLLGNSGNSDGPHLHFHIMDSPSPLQSNGLPFTFTKFNGQGRITDIGPLQEGGAVSVDTAVWAGQQRNRMPLGDEVIAFPGG